MKKYPVYNIQNFDRFSNSRELYINTFANHLKRHSFIEEPHRHNFYLIVLFTKGNGVHEIDFNEYTINAGSLYLLQPGQIHHWSLSKDIEGHIVFYSKEIYDLYFRKKNISDYPFYSSANNNPEVIFEASELESIQHYFKLLYEESRGKDLMRLDKLLNLLDIIHIQISRKYMISNTHQSYAYNNKLREFELLLEQHYTLEKLPSFYASNMNITLKHLNRICKDILGKTATQVITNRVILEAKRMLMDKRMSVNEIASGLGFTDYSYFTRLFKKHARVTPTGFRELKKF